MAFSHFDGIQWLNRGRGVGPGMVVRDFRGRYGVNYAHEGRILFSCDGRGPVSVAAPIAWLTRPGHFEYGTRDGSAWGNRFLNFTGPRVARFIESGLFPEDDPLIPVRQGEKVRAAFDELHDLLGARRPSPPRAVHLLEGLLLLLHEQRTLAETPAPRVAAIDAWCRRIREAPHLDWDAAQGAERAGLSYRAFRKNFRDLTGLAPHQYLLQARMERAAALLSTGHLPIREVGERVGFPDLFQFSKRFKSRFKLSPRAWREESRAPQSRNRPER